MSEQEVIATDEAPAAIGPYSQAVKSGGFLFLSGQIAIDPNSNQLIEGDVKAEVKQIFANIEAVLKEADLKLEDVVKTTIFVADMDKFSEINEVYSSCFKGHKPARSCVEASRLPKDVSVEIETIAKI